MKCQSLINPSGMLRLVPSLSTLNLHHMIRLTTPCDPHVCKLLTARWRYVCFCWRPESRLQVSTLTRAYRARAASAPRRPAHRKEPVYNGRCRSTQTWHSIVPWKTGHAPAATVVPLSKNVTHRVLTTSHEARRAARHKKKHTAALMGFYRPEPTGRVASSGRADKRRPTESTKRARHTRPRLTVKHRACYISHLVA